MPESETRDEENFDETFFREDSPEVQGLLKDIGIRSDLLGRAKNAYLSGDTNFLIAASKVGTKEWAAFKIADALSSDFLGTEAINVWRKYFKVGGLLSSEAEVFSDLSSEELRKILDESGGVCNSESDPSLSSFLRKNGINEPCLLLSTKIADIFNTYYSAQVNSNYAFTAAGLDEYPPSLIQDREGLNIVLPTLEIDIREEKENKKVLEIFPEGEHHKVVDLMSVAKIVRFGKHYQEIIEKIGQNVTLTSSESTEKHMISEDKLMVFKSAVGNAIISEFDYEDNRVPDEFRDFAGLWEEPHSHIVLNLDVIKEIDTRNQLIVLMLAVRDFIDDLAWPSSGNGTAVMGVLSKDGSYSKFSNLSQITDDCSCLVCSWDYD